MVSCGSKEGVGVSYDCLSISSHKRCCSTEGFIRIEYLDAMESHIHVRKAFKEGFKHLRNLPQAIFLGVDSLL